MTRRLLPYEHDLIATLGVTEEEYLNFLSIQEAYSDPKEGTIVDIRNMPPAGRCYCGGVCSGHSWQRATQQPSR
jgi:hypothetical protein